MRRRLLDKVRLCVFAALATSWLGCTGDPAGSAVVKDQNAYLAELADKENPRANGSIVCRWPCQSTR